MTWTTAPANSLVFALVMVGISVCCAAPAGEGACSQWTFDSSSAIGPSRWTSFCPACGGPNQSPINIPIDNVLLPEDITMFEPLQFKMDSIKSDTYFGVTNNGHTLSINFPHGLISVTGAGLSGIYYAAFMHWHWGKSRSTGSEHKLNGTKYVMEGHLVFHHSAYNSTKEALMHPNGVAAFAILYKDDFETPNIYSTIINNQTLGKLTEPGASKVIPAFSINYLLPFKLTPFYRYYGSLTYPPCTEGIIWTIFAQPVSLTSEQLQLLRNLHYDEAEKSGPMDDLMMVNNYRPVQPLNNRPVYVVDPYSYIQLNQVSEDRGSTVRSLLAYFNSVWKSIFP